MGMLNGQQKKAVFKVTNRRQVTVVVRAVAIPTLRKAGILCPPKVNYVIMKNRISSRNIMING